MEQEEHPLDTRAPASVARPGFFRHDARGGYVFASHYLATWVPRYAGDIGDDIPGFDGKSLPPMLARLGLLFTSEPVATGGAEATSYSSSCTSVFP